MKCDEARRYLSLYLDSELDSGETFRINEHLDRCEGCQKRFDRERTVDHMVADRLAAGSMPEDVWAAIQRNVLTASQSEGEAGFQSQLRPARRGRLEGIRRIRFWSVLALAACLAVIVFVPWTTRSGGEVDSWAVAGFMAINGQAPASLTAMADLQLAAREVLGRDVSVMLPPEEVTGHRLHLVRAASRHDASGTWVEVQFDCCDEPVLMTLAAADQPGPLAALVAELERKKRVLRRHEGLNVAGWRKDGLVVLAVSPHRIDKLIDVLQVDTQLSLGALRGITTGDRITSDIRRKGASRVPEGRVSA